MPNILIPEALKAIADEKNFFLYQMPFKAPVSVGRVGVPRNTDEAAVSTLWEVVEKLEYLKRKPGVLEKINAERREWAEKHGVEFREIAGFCVGYVPREESAGVVVDMDKCVDDRGEVLVDDFGLQAAFDAYEGYWEISPSGRGVRAVMPRGDWDELKSDRREAGGVAFQAAQEKAKGFTLTLQGGDRGWIRDDALVDEVVRVRDAGLREKRAPKGGAGGDLGDVALEWAHVTIEDLEGMLGKVPNEGAQKNERDWFVGMTKAVREVFEPRGLGEAAWDVWDAWVASREGGGYDYGWNRRVWDEPIGRSGEMTIGGLLKEAHENGWKGSWEEGGGPKEKIENRDEEFDLEMDADEIAAEPDWGDPLVRFAQINGSYLDRLTWGWKSMSEMVRLTRGAKMLDPKGKPIRKSEIGKRSIWLDLNIPQWDRMDFWPGVGETFRDRVGLKVLNTYRPLLRVSGGPDDAGVWVDQVRATFGEDADLLFDWMAFVMQNPGQKAGFAPVLVSEHEGAGKDYALTPLREYLGGYSGVVGLHQLEDDKNAGVLMHKLLLMVEESAQGRFADKVNIAEKLKPLIAAPPDTLTVRAMRRDHFEIRNVLNICVLVNQLDALHMDMGTRRYYPIVTEFGRDWDRGAKNEWWAPRWGWMRDGGWKAAARWLLGRKVERVQRDMNAPESRWLKDVVRAGMPPGADWVEDYCEGREWVSTRQIAEAGVMADGVSKVPVGKVLIRVLEGLGYKRLGGGRMSVRVGEKVYKHAVMVKDLKRADVTTIYDALSSNDDEVIDKIQRSGHLRLV